MNKFSLLLSVIVFGLLLTACGGDVVIKPSARLSLDYGVATYDSLRMDCPFQFQKNTKTILIEGKNCGVNLRYPNMKATVYLTYQEIKDDNLNAMLLDAQKLAYGHISKADAIPEVPFVNPDDKVYGMFYPINGDAASQAQFYVTDSVRHFINGALYFEAKPNFDSIYPAVVYMRDDIRRIMETITWKEK